MFRTHPLLVLVSVGLLCGCQPRGKRTDESARRPDSNASDSIAARTVVRQLGERLRRVSLLGRRPDLVEAIRREYASFVTPALLEKWIGDPASAPGRLTSSPWPDEIDVKSMVREPDGRYTVIGAVVERTSAEPSGSPGTRIAVGLRLVRVDGRWLIAEYDEDRVSPSAGFGPADEDSPAAAVNVIAAYYRAIAERRYDDAYRLWGSGGAASGKSFEQFRSGFSETATVEVTLRPPGPLGAAAGSRYVDVPVRVVAKLRNGTTQEFTGTYTIRRSVVDGATPEQRAWHIYTAKLRQVR